MELLKQHEDYLDKTALEISKVYIDRQLPTSDSDRIVVATASYKQALAMLEVKLGLEAVLNKSPYLVSYRVKEGKAKKN